MGKKTLKAKKKNVFQFNVKTNLPTKVIGYKKIQMSLTEFITSSMYLAFYDKAMALEPRGVNRRDELNYKY